MLLSLFFFGIYATIYITTYYEKLSKAGQLLLIFIRGLSVTFLEVVEGNRAFVVSCIFRFILKSWQKTPPFRGRLPYTPTTSGCYETLNGLTRSHLMASLIHVIHY